MKIRYYLLDKILWWKVILGSIKRWFRIRHRVMSLYEYDYSCLLEMEEYQLKRFYDVNKNELPFSDTNMRMIRLCIKLIHAIQWAENNVPNVNTRNEYRFGTWNPRVLDEDPKWMYEYYQRELYKRKALYLYNKIRNEHMFDWQ